MPIFQDAAETSLCKTASSGQRNSYKKQCHTGKETYIKNSVILSEAKDLKWFFVPPGMTLFLLLFLYFLQPYLSYAFSSSSVRSALVRVLSCVSLTSLSLTILVACLWMERSR